VPEKWPAAKIPGKGNSKYSSNINHTGLLLITPAIEIANEDIMPGQPMSGINSVVSILNSLLYYSVCGIVSRMVGLKSKK
jgi:hypothetical protein